METVTSTKRGDETEHELVMSLLKHGIPAPTIFHDLYIRKRTGEFTQIDLVVVTKVGIIVIEVKKLSGWIFGNGNNTTWTQVLAYGDQKYRIYNPILQNNNHIRALKNSLKQFQNIPFFSLVVFYGECVLKEIDYVPKGTFLVKAYRVMEVIDNILKENPPAPYTNKREVINFFKSAVQNGDNPNIKYQHLENISNMLGKDRIYE